MHTIDNYCRHLGPHASTADHWMAIYRGDGIIAIANLASRNVKTASGDCRCGHRVFNHARDHHSAHKLACDACECKSYKPDAKTQPIAGIYIIKTDETPYEAMKAGRDSEICGICPQRPSTRGKCYVNVSRGPQAAYRNIATARDFDAEAFRGYFVRFGEYGDPALIPANIISDIVSVSSGHTGYTHMWLLKRMDVYKRWFMASVENEKLATLAHDRGWRYFYVATDSDDKPEGLKLFSCPASKEAGHRLSCFQCGGCDGTMDKPGRSNPVIILHGFRTDTTGGK